MPNTLTDLIPDIYNALDVVSRELVGFIPAVTMDATYDRAALNQVVRSPVAPASTASDIVPGVTPPDDGDQEIGNVEMRITKSRRVPVRWNGEEQRGLNNNGASQSVIMQNQFQQAFRTLTNEVEADLAALHIASSRAVGVAGTTPFDVQGDFSDAANVLKVLKDNGAPQSDNQLVMNTTAGAKIIGKQSRADFSGTTDIQRQGVILPLAGIDLRESAQVVTSVAGTASGATTDPSGYAVGDTEITLAAAGTGTILAGDVITFAGDTNQYVVAVGNADVSAGGTITLAAPGLRQAIDTSSQAITVVGAAARNMGFSRSAIALATRVPALFNGRDMAVAREIITDPVSNISFEIAEYVQYRQTQYEVSLAWGQQCVKPEHTALLLG